MRSPLSCAQQGYDVRSSPPWKRGPHYKASALAWFENRHRRRVRHAIFDADFVPDRGFLRHLIPLFAERDDVCVVQGRQGHLNANESWITEGLSLGLDMHFAIEQAARNWNGLLMAQRHRRHLAQAAIDDPRVGGWSGDHHRRP